MLKRIFHHRSHSISSAAIVVAAFTAGGAMLSILRNSLLAATFGAGAELDVYYAAFRIPDFVYGIFYLGVVSVLFLPIFNTLYVEDKQKAWRFFGAMVSWVTIVLSLGALVLFFLAPWIMKFLVPGFTPHQLELVIVLTRIMLLQPILLGASNIVSGTLQSFQRFAAAAMGHIFYNGGIILGIIAFVPVMGVEGLAWGVVAGALLHLLVQLPSLLHVHDTDRFTFVPDFEIVRPHLALVPPRIFNVISNQANLIIITIFASMANEGSLAIFNFAHDIQMLPQTAIAVSFAVAAFPTLSRLAFHNKAKFYRVLNQTLRRIFFFLVPVGMFLIVFRAQLVRLVLGYGAFGWADTRLTLETLAIFAMGLLFQGMLPFLVRAFFSLHDTKTPLISALVGNAMTIGLGYYLLDGMGVRGLAIALVVANMVQAGILYLALARRDLIEASWILRRGVLIVFLSAIAAIVGHYALELFAFLFFTSTFNTEVVHGLALQTLFAGLSGLAVLAVLFHVFHIEEYKELIAGIRARLAS